jgi:hypothetical protein
LSGTTTSENTPASAPDNSPAKRGSAAMRLLKTGAPLHELPAQDTLERSQRLARALGAQVVMRHDLEPAAARRERDEAAVAARALDRRA